MAGSRAGGASEDAADGWMSAGKACCAETEGDSISFAMAHVCMTIADGLLTDTTWPAMLLKAMQPCFS